MTPNNPRSLPSVHNSTRRWLWLETGLWRKATKTCDSLITVFLVDPLIRLVLPLLMRAGFSPNAVTMIGLGVSAGTAWLFHDGHLAPGGLAFFAWYIVDCIDGKLARVADRCTQFGYWLDLVTDRFGTSAVFIGLATGSLRNGDDVTALLAVVMLVLWLLFSQNAEVMISIHGHYSARELLPEHAPANDVAARQRSSIALRVCERLRLNPMCIQSVEWLMLAATIGPLVGATRECLAAAIVGSSLQRLAHIAGFWWRRRKEIASV